jgi:hypothetical protein
VKKKLFIYGAIIIVLTLVLPYIADGLRGLAMGWFLFCFGFPLTMIIVWHEEKYSPSNSKYDYFGRKRNQYFFD